MKVQSGIYFIVNKINNKIYVGSAVRLSRRKNEHWWRLSNDKHHNSYLQRAWNKYGEENFEFKIIEYCNREDLLSKETSYISFFNTTDENIGYNSCEVGRSALGRKLSQATKDKIGKAHKGKKLKPYQIEALKNANLGVKHSPERVKAHTERTKGRKHPPRSKEFLEKIKIINTELANRRWSKSREQPRKPIVLTGKQIQLIER